MIMEIDMAKQRTNKRGFVFENKIDLSQWIFNHLEMNEEDAFREFEDNIVKAIEKERKRLEDKLGSAETRVRKIASTALQIAFEKNISAGFWEVHSKPEIINIHFEDFAEGGYEVKIDIKKAIKDCLIGLCDNDGYILKSEEAAVIKFANMLKSLENEVRTAIRPKNEA